VSQEYKECNRQTVPVVYGYLGYLMIEQQTGRVVDAKFASESRTSSRTPAWKRQVSDESTDIESDFPFDDSNDAAWSRQTSTCSVTSADQFEYEDVKTLEQSSSAVLIQNLPRTFTSVDMEDELRTNGFEPGLDFTFLHVPSQDSHSSSAYCVINFVDASTRNSFMSAFQGKTVCKGSAQEDLNVKPFQSPPGIESLLCEKDEEGASK